MVSCMFDINTSIHMHWFALVGFMMRTLDYQETPLWFFLLLGCDRVSHSNLKIAWASGCLTYVYILSHRSTLYWLWLGSFESSWIQNVSCRDHDHIYYKCLSYMDPQCNIWRSCFVSIPNHGYVHLGYYHIGSILGFLHVLTSLLLCFSFFSILFSILGIYCKVFWESSPFLASHFRGHLLYPYLPPTWYPYRLEVDWVNM